MSKFDQFIILVMVAAYKLLFTAHYSRYRGGGGFDQMMQDYMHC